jgi:hypothetical protein
MAILKLLCIVEIEGARDSDAAQRRLDAFRESVLPDLEHGITIYRVADPADLDGAILLDGRPLGAR